jgi:hypothetical protein
MNEIEGGCFCGAIRYRIVDRPSSSVICHCVSCREASGAVAVGWLTFDCSQVEFTRGSLRIYASSPGVERGFCADCGSALSFRVANRPQEIDLTTITLDDPNAFPPDREVWTEHRLPWVAANPALAQYANGS